MTTTAKKVIARALPINTTYKILSSYYLSIEEGGGRCCENCGRLITNIAEIESKEGNKYLVGMDCAGTLSGISGNFDFEYIHKANFAAAKAARAAIVKAIKQGKVKNLTASSSINTGNFYKEIGAGMWEYEFISGGYNWKQYPREVWQNYVFPMIKDLIITPTVI